MDDDVVWVGLLIVSVAFIVAAVEVMAMSGGVQAALGRLGL
jgi:hypothetical protein